MDMTGAEVAQEIRSLLREPQLNTVSTPWTYDAGDLNVQIRSAFRYLRVLGVDPIATVDADGEFSEDIAENVGLLVAYYVAHRLVAGDLAQKLIDGELGVLFRTGTDIIDTKTASQSFKAVAAEYEFRFDTLLAMSLTDAEGGSSSVYGGQTALTDGETT
jgi:hypothetical protein